MLITLAALGLPGLNGFVGEFLILMGVWTSLLLADLSAIYVLMAGLAICFCFDLHAPYVSRRDAGKK